MVPHLLSWLAAWNPGFACPGRGETAARDTCPGEKTAAAIPNPAASARNVELVGDACAWTTGAMAARILEEGTPWSVVGRLSPAPNELPSKVAAPYTLGPDARVRVVANAVLERLIQTGSASGRLEFTGRLLEVDGTTYFVATEVSASHS